MASTFRFCMRRSQDSHSRDHRLLTNAKQHDRKTSENQKGKRRIEIVTQRARCANRSLERRRRGQASRAQFSHFACGAVLRQL